MKASIAFKNGILDKIALEKTDGFAMPDETDQKNFMAVLDSYLPDVIRLWKDTFIYKKSVKKEIIQKKL